MYPLACEACRYATVMFSTGPMFVTIQCALYAHKDKLSVLPVELYGKYKVRAVKVSMRATILVLRQRAGLQDKYVCCVL